MTVLPYQSRRLSVSNIAWPNDADREAIALAKKIGFDGIEVAPTKVFGDIATIPSHAVQQYRRQLNDLGLEVPALQSILFGSKIAHLFQSDQTRAVMKDHLVRIADLAARLGAKACVFGAPGLRDPGELAPAEAFEIAQAFFQDLAPAYASRGVSLCIEANPSLYNCRFLTHTHQALEFVEAVDRDGIALQFDTGTVFANGETPPLSSAMADRIRHFHISQPGLTPVASGEFDHASVGQALRQAHYAGWISVEMKAAADWRQALWDAYSLAREAYL